MKFNGLMVLLFAGLVYLSYGKKLNRAEHVRGGQ